MLGTSGGSSPIPVLENFKGLFSVEEYSKMGRFFEENWNIDKVPTVEQFAKKLKLSDLVDYSKREVGWEKE
jgi:hypothetical protein